MRKINAHIFFHSLYYSLEGAIINLLSHSLAPFYLSHLFQSVIIPLDKTHFSENFAVYTSVIIVQVFM